MTWPLAAGLARDVPGDLGDSLLNMWILGWGAEQRAAAAHRPDVAAATSGTRTSSIPSRWRSSFSEHLFGQVLQILPVYHLTGNLILSYNLLFLTSFVALGPGHVPAGPRSRSASDRGRSMALRRVRRRSDLRVRPVSHRAGRAHPVAQLAVDAAGALRLSPVHRRTRPRRTAARLAASRRC